MPGSREARTPLAPERFQAPPLEKRVRSERIPQPEKLRVLEGGKREIHDSDSIAERVFEFQYEVGENVEQINEETGQYESWRVDFSNAEGQFVALVKDAPEASWHDIKVVDKMELAIMGASTQLAKEYEPVWSAFIAEAEDSQQQLEQQRAKILDICGREELLSPASPEFRSSPRARQERLKEVAKEVFQQRHPAHRQAELVEAEIETTAALEDIHNDVTEPRIAERLLRAETRRRILVGPDQADEMSRHEMTLLQQAMDPTKAEKLQGQEEALWQELKQKRMSANRLLQGENDLTAAKLAEIYRDLCFTEEEARYSTLLNERLENEPAWNELMTELEARISPVDTVPLRKAAQKDVYERKKEQTHKERAARESARIKSQRAIALRASIEEESNEHSLTSKPSPQEAQPPKKQTWKQHLKSWSFGLIDWE